MSLIKNWSEQDQYFLSGTLYVPLFGGEIDVLVEKEVSPQYAEKCAENLVSLDDETVEHLCERVSAYRK